ncbi:MAG: type II secretion system secretin GspD [Methylococcales bacterium]
MSKVKNVAAATCIMAVGFSLASCELLGPDKATKLPLSPVTQIQDDQANGAVIKDLQNKPPVDANKPKAELFPGNDQFVSNNPEQHRKVKGSGEGSYSLNFDEADLGEVAKVVLSDILGQNYVLSPKVTGKVTLQTTDPLTKDELIPTLEMLLRMNNAVLIKDASIYHIEPDSEALYSSSFNAPGVAGRTGYQIRVIPIRNVAVQDIVEVIKPLVQEKTILNVDNTRNILVASGTPDELGRVLDMVSTFDIDVLKGRSFALFPLTHVNPETIIKELEEVFSKKGAEESSFFRFIPIERLNSVMAITHQARYLKDIESWISRLDRANTATGGGVNVYKVQNVDALELAATLGDIFVGGGQSSGSSAKLAPGKKAVSVSNKLGGKSDSSQSGSKAGAGLKSAANTNSAGNAAGGGSTSSGDAKVANVGEIKIIADAANNSLVIVATAQEYGVILPIIKQLDILPLQVLIDATIAEVALTDKLKYGIEWYLREGNTAVGSGLSGVNLGDLANKGAAAFATGGLSLVQNSGAVQALLSAQASDGNVNVISSPSLMVLNNQEATIEVGTQIPILTNSLAGVGVGSLNSGIGSSGTAGLTSSNSISYKDTGVKLGVIPRVNANGMVIMQIQQSVSDPVETTIGVTQSASISKKEINSSVAVQDGETIVLGGMIKETDTYNKAGIPFLHELPLIGPMFGNTTNDKIKTELVVLITPRVVKSKQDARVISDEFKRKLTGIYEEPVKPEAVE